MKIQSMFQKDIDRDINGVIKVSQDDQQSLKQELSEYIITKELRRHFATFFDNYAKAIDNPTDKIGVWISGFFGSGKSHFLKMLSYLLSNKEVDGKHAFDYFADKFDDPMMYATVQKCVRIPTESILFNIDIEGPINKDKTAVLRVFAKVFYNHCGFYGEDLKVAKLERFIDKQGKTEAFRAAFKEVNGDEWVNARDSAAFFEDDVVEVLQSVLGMSETAARNWFNGEENADMSIKQLVSEIKEYVDSKEGNFRLLFCVDEVGQYIGDDGDLMMNLQSLVEEIGDKCRGKVWVMVTSQEAIDSVVKITGNDFSKIQGRFDTRLSLSSANVDAVIKKRILDKTETAAQSLRLLYDQKATIIKNLIVFNDGVEKKLYANAEDFAEVYPFVPYQFNLLASVLTSIRTHGASGKHLSGGERSMLALFKESAVNIMNEETGVIVPFHRFYDALENFLDHSHSGVIIRAYDNSYINPEKKDKDVFAINVLKTLFMIKYVLEIEANIDNITSLMIENIDDDRIELKGRVEEALKVLMRQMLVQKNGSIYVFLTDEEQEVNNEIEKENVETPVIINKVAEMIFEDIFPGKKYIYPTFNGRYAFSFNQSVDDRPYKANQSYDIGVRILTPWYDGSTDDATLRMMSGQGKEVLVVLPDDAEFLKEMQAYLKIEGFLRKNTSTQLPKYETIKQAKIVEMQDRNANAKLYLTEALKEATIYVNGDVARVSGKEVGTRINEAIGRLVQTVYHKLSYIDTPMGEAEIRKLLHTSNQLSLGLEDGTESNAHALDDVQGFISLNTRNHMKTSMKSVKDRFMKAPYGFVEDDVFWLVARLFKRGDLTFTVNGATVSLNNKTEEEIIGFITKKAFVEKLLMEERTRVPDKDKKAVRDVMKEVFQTTTSAEDEDTIMKNFQRYAQNTIYEIERLEVYYKEHRYPGKKVLETGKNLMLAVVQIQSAMDFFTTISKKRDDFYDFAEDYEPIKAFFAGEQLTIFTRALDMLAIYDDSKTYIVNAELEDIVAQMRSIVGQEKPYANIPKLPELREKFMSCYVKILQQESAPVLDSIDQARSRVLEVLSTKEYNDQKRSTYFAQFQEIRDGAEHCNNVSSLRSYADKADALKLRLLNEMDALDNKLAQQRAAEEARRKAEEAKQSGTSTDEVEIAPAPVKIRKTKNVSIKMMTGTSSWRLESKADIDKYIADLRKTLEAQLDEDTIVNVEF